MLKRRWIFVGLVAVAVLALIGALSYRPVLTWWLHTRPFSAEAFDPMRWRSGLKASQEGECVRGRMANDIIATVARPGQPKFAVEAVLGIPQLRRGDLTGYELGMCSGLGVDFDSLYIEYSNDKVRGAYHVQH